MSKITSINPIASNNSLNLSKGTYDGKNLYFLSNSTNKVYLFSPDLKEYKIIDLIRKYTCLTYDEKEDCFWAYDPYENTTIYKLDKDMIEIGSTTITYPNSRKIEILFLSYNQFTDSFFINISGDLLELDKTGEELKIISSNGQIHYSDILPLKAYTATLCTIKDDEYLRVFNANSHLTLCKLPSKFKFKSIIHCLNDDLNEISLVILATDTNNLDLLIKIVIDYNTTANKSDSSQIPNYNSNDIDTDKCSKCSCSSDHCQCEHPCYCSDNLYCLDICNSLSDFIKSIALVETSIVNILISEREKFQNGIELSSSVQELIDINSSIEKILSKITILETQLYSHLVATKESYNERNE